MDDDGNLPDASGGDGQDMCSFFHSVFAHRESMVRLINWLRNSQTTCTDTNCFDDLNAGLPGPEQAANRLTDDANPLFASDSDNFSLILWSVLIVLTLYALNLGRDRRLELQMRKNDSNNDDHQPGADPRPAL